MLKGLSYVHSQNIVHRDIKPENILLSSTGIIKICDFGVSRLFCPNQSLDLSADVGTLWYQAPEMLMRSKTYNTTVDIWSVGMYKKLNFENLVDNNCIMRRDFVHGISWWLAFGHQRKNY